MKKHLCILTFVLLLFALAVNADEPISILLKSPSDGAVITTYEQDFLYSFSEYVDILNCSLIVDDKVEGFRNILIRRTNNKMTIELEAGTHTWFMRCFDTEHSQILSEKRTLTVNVGAEIKEGYEILYNPNGLRSYVFTIAPGQSPVELPAMKGGEDIQIKIGKTVHYLDIIKMGVSGDTNFVEVRDRSAGTIHKMLVPSTFSFDFDKDKTIDIELSLIDVERNVNAYFVVTPYPGTTVEEEEEPEEVTEEPEQQPEEEEVIVVEDEEPVVKPPTPPEPQPGPEKKSNALLILVIIVIALVVIIALYLVLKGRGRVRTIHVGEEDPFSRPKTKKKKHKSSKHDEEWPLIDKKEKFDIIKSVEPKTRR